MDAAVIPPAVSALAVTVGVVFAGVQLLLLRRAGEQTTRGALVRSFTTKEFVRGLVELHALPDGLNGHDLEERPPATTETLWALMTMWESFGILVHHGELSLQLFEDFFSGPIVLSWQKLGSYVAEIRSQNGRETYWEWFQWLAERVRDDEASSPPIPAHAEY
jgi:hypothetical protein